MAQRLSIAGRVQGVGFREAVVDAARDAGVVGWVRNRRDGSVEVLVQGEPGAVARVVAACRRGPPIARVGAFDMVPVDPDPSLARFERLPTA